MVPDRPLHLGELRPARPRWTGFEATVDDELAAGDPLRLVAGEEQGHVGDVDRLAHPTEHLRGGTRGAHLIELALVGVGPAGGERRGDEARADGVDPDAV